MNDLIQSKLEEMSLALDDLIHCQRREQEIILSRRASELPALCEEINAITSRLRQAQNGLSRHLQGGLLPENYRSIHSNCARKLSLLQKLAVQNHLLLESSLEFLQEVFEHVVGCSGQKSAIYNALGIKPASYQPEAGGFLRVSA